MAVMRLTVSLTPELVVAVKNTATTMSLDVSRLVETLLRESPVLQEQIQRARGVGTKRGRSMDELLVLAKASRRQWERRIDSGQVRLLE